MKPATLLATTLTAALVSGAAAPTVNRKPETVNSGGSAAAPNIIFILTDDLGYGDIGCFWQNQRNESGKPAGATPNLDRMAAEGAMLTHHYCSAPVSAPSRASILSGLSQGHANVRDNQFDKALADNHTLATILRQAGYSTIAIGKWGLQGKGTLPNTPANPLNRGFDTYYGYLRHADGHEHYPKERVYHSTTKPTKKSKKQATPPEDDSDGIPDGKFNVWDNRTDVTSGLDKCYTADLWTARAKKFIIDHVKAAAPADGAAAPTVNREPGTVNRGGSAAAPFFMYLAYDTPHGVDEYPPCPYPAGGGLTGGVQWLGTPGHMINTATGKVDTYCHPDYAKKSWPEVNKRYATSVRRIDDCVGDLLQLLKDLAIDDNTLVIFTSDNGPSIESGLPQHLSPQFFGSYGPFDGIKRDTWEGGLREPTIARWPARIPAGRTITAPSALYDWLPTFAEAAHLVPPANTDGVSLLPNLTAGSSSEISNLKSEIPTALGRGTNRPNDYLYIEYNYKGRTPNYPEFEPGHRGRQRNQMQTIRQGDLVAVRYDIKSAQDDFEIYDAVTDPKEAHNLAAKAKNTPEMQTLQTHFKSLALQSRRPEPDTHRPYDAALVPAVSAPAATTPGLAWCYYEGNFPWTPDTANLTAQKTGSTPSVQLSAFQPFSLSALSPNAAIVFHGYLNAPADGDYIFALATDTGALLRLHQATIIDADYAYKPNATRTASIHLKAGLHPITLTYHTDGKRPPALSLKWQLPGTAALQPIPAAAFVQPIPAVVIAQ